MKQKNTPSALPRSAPGSFRSTRALELPVAGSRLPSARDAGSVKKEHGYKNQPIDVVPFLKLWQLVICWITLDEMANFKKEQNSDEFALPDQR